MGTARLIVIVSMLIFTAAVLVCDLRTRKLPNVLTVPVFLAGLLFHAINGFCQKGLSGAFFDLRFALGGFAFGFGVMLFLWIIGGGGGGDVKFMGALGCWLGTWITFQILVLSAAFSGALTMTLLLKNVFQMKKLTVRQSGGRFDGAGNKRRSSAWRVPFGVPAAVGTWCVLLLELAGYSLPWPPPIK